MAPARSMDATTAGPSRGCCVSRGRDEPNMPPKGPLPLVDVDAIAHRYSSYDTPFWARENSEPGRWHVRGDGPTQYLSLSSDGAWAELIRNERLTSEDE